MSDNKKIIMLKAAAFVVAFGLSVVYPCIYAADFHQKYAAEAILDTIFVSRT